MFYCYNRYLTMVLVSLFCYPQILINYLCITEHTAVIFTHCLGVQPCRNNTIIHSISVCNNHELQLKVKTPHQQYSLEHKARFDISEECKVWNAEKQQNKVYTRKTLILTIVVSSR